MNIKVWRANEDQPVSIDFRAVLKDSVRWTRTISLNGKSRPAKVPIIECKIDYKAAMEAGLASGDHEKFNNPANVYLYESHNKEKDCIDGYRCLCKLAGEKPGRYTGVPAGQPPCTKKILDELGAEKHLRADIKKRLMDLGYDEETIRRAFKRLEKTGRIFFSSENHSLKNCEVWAAK